MKISQVLVKQIYFRFQDIICIQHEGLAMGAPTSSIFSEIYLQYIENTKIFELLSERKVDGYFRQVDDILVMYKEDQTNIQEKLDNFNNLMPIIKFTVEKENGNKINFLDVTIAKEQDDISFDTYRKPTTTDVILPNDSCHPREHKTVAIRYLHNGMKTYNLCWVPSPRPSGAQVYVGKRWWNTRVSRTTTLFVRLECRLALLYLAWQ